MDVCIFSDKGVETLSTDGSDVAVYEGKYESDNLPKLSVKWKQGRYVGFGCPGNFDATTPCEVVNRIHKLP